MGIVNVVLDLGVKLGLPAIGALSHRFFLGGRVPPLISTTENSWYPYSNLSTGGPSKSSTC